MKILCVVAVLCLTGCVAKPTHNRIVLYHLKDYPCSHCGKTLDDPLEVARPTVPVHCKCAVFRGGE